MIDQQTGTEAWWQARAAQGGPTITPCSDNDCTVTFWWRDPQGTESHSLTRRVWIYITGITDHHNLSTPQTLARIEGTDVWRWETVLPATWRGSYCFIPSMRDNDFPPDVFSPSGPDRAGLRAGWRTLLPDAISDPLNPHSWQGGRGHFTSGLHLPAAPPQPGWNVEQIAYPAPRCIHWHSEKLGNSRRVWIFTPGDAGNEARPLALLLDGQFWAESMPVWPALDKLTRDGALPPAVYLLVDAIDTAHRTRELPCNARFWQAIVDELLPQIRAQVLWREDPATTIVAGQSFGGLSALYAALHFPDQFGCVISQSGSYWWPDRQNGHQDGILPEQIRNGTLAWSAPRLWLEAGIREPLIHAANSRLYALLQKMQQPVFWRQVDGGHDALCWRGGLTSGLIALWGQQPVSLSV